MISFSLNQHKLLLTSPNLFSLSKFSLSFIFLHSFSHYFCAFLSKFTPVIVPQPAKTSAKKMHAIKAKSHTFIIFLIASKRKKRKNQMDWWYGKTFEHTKKMRERRSKRNRTQHHKRKACEVKSEVEFSSLFSQFFSSFSFHAVLVHSFQFSFSWFLFLAWVVNRNNTIIIIIII